MENILFTIFYKLVFMSVIGVLIGLSIILIRKIFDKKISPIWKFAMWFLLILALIVPYRFPYASTIKIADTNYKASVSNSIEKAVKNIGKTDTVIPIRKGSSKDARVIGELELEEEIRIEDIIREEESKKAYFLKNVLPIIWLSGLALLLINLIVNRIGLEKLGKITIQNSKEQEEHSRIYSILNDCKINLNIEKNINISLQDKINTPAIFGLIKPTILIPKYSNNLSDESLSYVIYHELAHYKLKHILINYVLMLCQVVYWFNPIIWMIFKFIRDDIEVLADEYVINHIGNERSKDYSKSLIEVLANANRIAFMPKVLCMVDGKKNIERRINMIKLGEKFKKNKIIISIFSIAIILILAGVFLTTGKKEHKVEIYAIEGLDFPKSEYQNLIKDKTPAITEKDIVGYNKETKMIFLSDEKTKQYEIDKRAKSEKDLYVYGGSIYLQTEPYVETFIVAVDGEALFGGTIHRSLVVSYIPSGLHIKDCHGGLRMYSHKWNRENTDISEKFINAMDDMGLLTDKVFHIETKGNGLDGNSYDIDKLWELKADKYNDVDLEELANSLIFPLELRTIRASDIIDGKLGMKIVLDNSEKDIETYMETSDEFNVGDEKRKVKYLYDTYIFRQNSKILFSLIDDLDYIEYTFTKDADYSSLVYLKENSIDDLSIIKDLEKKAEYDKYIFEALSKTSDGYDDIKSAFDLYILLERMDVFANVYGEELNYSTEKDGDDLPVEKFTEEEEAALEKKREEKFDKVKEHKKRLEYIAKKQAERIKKKEETLKKIEKAIDKIVSEKEPYSSPYHYVGEHEEEYKYLFTEGEIVIDYILGELAKEDEGTDLKGYVMALICQDLIGITADVGDFATGKEWFNIYVDRDVINLDNYDYKNHEKYSYIEGKITKDIEKTAERIFESLPYDEKHGEFIIRTVKVIDTVKEDNYIKIFVNINDQKFKLYKSFHGTYSIYDLGYDETISALTFRIDDNDDYNLEKIEYVKGEGAMYFDSVKEISKTPITKKNLDTVSNEIFEHQNEDIKYKTKENLRKHLIDNKIELSKNRIKKYRIISRDEEFKGGF